jgi:glycosyltransferase involved in cell wall biosynthesis
MSLLQVGLAPVADVQVSVILPTYNRAHFLHAAVTSVLSQNITGFELIVVDDGSKDNTQAVMGTFSDPRLVLITQKNGGRSQARNRALSQAKGKLIAFLDSDDLYLPGKLALQIEYMNAHPDVGMIYTSAYCIDHAGNPLPENYVASVSGWIYKSIAFFRPVTITLPTVMLRRELFDVAGSFDENMHRFEDTDMWRRLSKVTQIHALPTFTCSLRTHDDNSLLAQNPVKIIEALQYYSSKIIAEDKTIGFLTIRRGLGHLYDYYGRAFLTVPEWQPEGWHLIRVAYRFWPLLWFHQILLAVYYRLKPK